MPVDADGSTFWFLERRWKQGFHEACLNDASPLPISNLSSHCNRFIKIDWSLRIKKRASPSPHSSSIIQHWDACHWTYLSTVDAQRICWSSARFFSLCCSLAIPKDRPPISLFCSVHIHRCLVCSSELYSALHPHTSWLPVAMLQFVPRHRQLHRASLLSD